MEAKEPAKAAEELVAAFAELAPAIKELSEALKSMTDILPKRKVIIKGADVPPKKYGLYLQEKKNRKRRHK